MTDDELDRWLRAARPHTPADDGWADTDAGDDALTGITAAVGERSPRRGLGAGRLRRPLRSPYGLGIGFAAVAATVIGVGIALPSQAPRQEVHHGRGSNTPTPTPVIGPVPARMELVGFDTCAGMRDALRRHAAAHVTAWGLGDDPSRLYALGKDVRGPVTASLPAPTSSSASGGAPTPDHSSTNDQEIGADEPDIVKTDGRRVISVSGGVLRVVDAGTRAITGTLDLRAYAGATSAQLLVSGDRALVLLGQPYEFPTRGPLLMPYRPGGDTGSTYLLVDLAGAPSVVSMLHTDGSYVDARLIGGVVRVVVTSQPKIAFPQWDGAGSGTREAARNRAIVRQAPIQAWLPTYQTTDDGRTVTHAVPCDRVSHPKRYTGASMVTVYSFDPSRSLDDPKPIAIAADATTVYATAHDLYVASGDGSRTQLHRFWLNGAAAPRYVGSGSVPGWLLNSYSVSDYAGTLRVVTSAGEQQETSLYVLDANTLRRRGSVSGLGVGENLHAVRFLGALAYVVTFRSVDPLYVLDLSNPDHPRKAGELKVTGYSDYLHPTDSGRLLGVGQDVDQEQRVDGLQVSLFDVSDPAKPSRLDNVVRKHTPSESPIDPHAFLYWPKTRTAVIPIDSWEGKESGAVLVVHVGADRLRVVGTLRNESVTTVPGYDTGIERTLVIGGDVWTMSSSGLLVSDLGSLARRGWVGFS